jgi:hypothetical protein
VFLGCRRKLTMDDLPPLPRYYEPLVWLEKAVKARRRGITTLRTVGILMSRKIATQALFAMTTAMLELVGPFSMYNPILFLQAPDQAVLHPAVWVLLLFLGPVARSILYQRYIYQHTTYCSHIICFCPRDLSKGYRQYFV